MLRLIEDILLYYINLEQECEDNELLYYVHGECDSCVTNFEGLSNLNKIVVATKLDKRHIASIMGIFQKIYDKNLWWFEESEWVEYQVYDDRKTSGPLHLSRQKLELLMSYTDIRPWIETFGLFNANEPVTEDSVGENSYYDYIPDFEYMSDNPDWCCDQKVYTLTMILELFNNNYKHEPILK